MSFLLILCFGLTAAMFGILWMVQLVHYPMFRGLDSKSFVTWHEFHSRRITFIVAPLMISEFIVSGLVAWNRRDWPGWTIFALTVFIWLATFLVSVPIHNRLSVARDGGRAETEHLISRLVQTNWLRTFLYSLKLGLVFSLF